MGVMELEGNPVGADDLAALALYNYGHFTSMLVSDAGVRGLGLHLTRLTDDSLVLFGSPVDPDRVRLLVRQALARCELPTVVRVTVFAPDLELSHPGGEFKPQILVTARSAPGAAPPPLTLETAIHERNLPRVKSVGLFATMAHRRAAQQRGLDDVLFVDHRGSVLEGATWNVGFVSGEAVLWPEADVLPGVTMRLVQAAAQDVDVTNEVAPVAAARLPGLDAAFVTNAAVGVRPVRSINGTEYPVEHGLVGRLQAAYDQIRAEQVD